LLVGEDFAVREAAVAVDRGVHVGVADPSNTGLMRGGASRAAVDFPPAAFGDAAQLLDVEMHELARSGHGDPLDRDPGHPVEMVEAVEVMADQDTVHGRRGRIHDPRDPRWAETAASTQGDDPAFQRRLGPGRRVVRPARAVLETGHALELVATPPHIGTIPGDPHRRRRMSDRPTTGDALTQQQSASGRETSVTVQQSLRCEWVR
jgi:hypothetical protein